MPPPTAPALSKPSVVDTAQGYQRHCTFGRTCTYVTAVWPKDDASAEAQLYRHKWARHEPEAENPKTAKSVKK